MPGRMITTSAKRRRRQDLVDDPAVVYAASPRFVREGLRQMILEGKIRLRPAGDRHADAIDLDGMPQLAGLEGRNTYRSVGRLRIRAITLIRVSQPKPRPEESPASD